jgi:hypothetical protein
MLLGNPGYQLTLQAPTLTLPRFRGRVKFSHSLPRERGRVRVGAGAI